MKSLAGHVGDSDVEDGGDESSVEFWGPDESALLGRSGARVVRSLHGAGGDVSELDRTTDRLCECSMEEIQWLWAQGQQRFVGRVACRSLLLLLLRLCLRCESSLLAAVHYTPYSLY